MKNRNRVCGVIAILIFVCCLGKTLCDGCFQGHSAQAAESTRILSTESGSEIDESLFAQSLIRQNPYVTVYFPAGRTSHLAQTEDLRGELLRRFFAALSAYETSFDIGDLNIPRAEQTDVRRIFADELSTNLELFYVSSVSLTVSSDRVERVNIYYDAQYRTGTEPKRELIEQELTIMREEIANALSGITVGMTALEKTLVIHDWMVREIDYAIDELNSGTLTSRIHSAVGALVDHKTVCSGYTEAFCGFMKLLGIPSYYVSSDTMNHAWNMVYLDGAWYHIDITWDDPIASSTSHGCGNLILEGYIRHDYFLLSDAEIGTDHSGWKNNITDEYAPPEAPTSGDFDEKLFRGLSAEAALHFYGDGWFFCSGQKLMHYNLDGVKIGERPLGVAPIAAFGIGEDYYYADSQRVYHMSLDGYESSSSENLVMCDAGQTIEEFTIKDGALIVNGIDTARTPSAYTHLVIPIQQTMSYDRLETLSDSAVLEYDLGETFTDADVIVYAVTKEGYKTALSPTDYEVTGFDSSAPGSGKVSITFRSMSVEKEFRTGVTIEDATVAAIAESIYSGEAICPQPVVTKGGVTLVLGTDYEISYANNISAGTASLTLQGIGSYTGKKTVEFEIGKYPVQKSEVILYYKAETRPENEDEFAYVRRIIVVTVNGKVLSAGDYAISRMFRYPGITDIHDVTQIDVDFSSSESQNYSGVVSIEESLYRPIEELLKEEPDPEKLVQDFVERMYTVALDRASDPDGLTFWKDLLISKEIDGAYLAGEFFNGPEFIGFALSDEEYLNRLYRTFFNREPDPEGMTFWLEGLSAGMTTQLQVLGSFVNSDEFTNVCESYGILRGDLDITKNMTPVEKFSYRLYHYILERPGEADGMAFYADVIANGKITPEDAAISFFCSDEYVNKQTSNEEFVETLYWTFMDRASDSEGRAFWLVQLDNGIATRMDALRDFCNCVEFSGVKAGFGL